MRNGMDMGLFLNVHSGNLLSGEMNRVSTDGVFCIACVLIKYLECVCVCCQHTCLCTTYMQCPWRPEDLTSGTAVLVAISHVGGRN